MYFDCTSGGEAGAGQLWQLTPRGKDRGDLKLIFESPGADVLDAPDNLVPVPATGDVFLQEDGGGEQFVRGVTKRGEIYDFAKTVTQRHGVLRRLLQPGRPDVLRLPAGRARRGHAAARTARALTYAIWGPFESTQ